MKKWCLKTLGTITVLLLVFSGNVFAASENDSQTGTDGVNNLLGITTSEAVGVTYHTHVENKGWETYWASNEGPAGTQGESLRLEGIEIKLTGDLPEDAKIEYHTHVQNQGWENYWANNGVTAGTQGLSLRLEGIQIRLVNMPDYSIEYRTHVQNKGWETKWAKDGETSGTEGQSLRLEGIQIRIIKENADLTAYNKTLATAKAVPKTNYSTYSWDNLQTVIKNNVVTVKSTQEKVDAATAAIKTAYAALESVVNARVYSTSGTFGPSSGLETISQDVVIKSDGVTLQNMHITGDLIISEEVGQGNATLNNITVDGETFIRGGGKNSIHINGGNYKRITIQETASGQVRIVATNAKGIDVVIAEDAASEDVILEGAFDTVTVNATKMKISTRGATTIREMTVAKVGAGSQVTLDDNSRIERMVFNGKADVKGQGAIGDSQVNADNVTYEKAPEKQTVAKTVKVPPKAPVVKVPVTGITLSGAGNVKTLAKAGTLQITAAVAPANATNNKVTWSIVNGTGTASISNAGVVTGLTAGTVTVNATAQDGSGKIGTLTLTVADVTAGTIATVSTINSSTVNPSFTITLTNDTFTDVASTVSNWTTAMGVTGLKVASITRYSNNQVIIGTTGTAAVGTITFKANAAALTKNLASNTLTVTVNPVLVNSITVTGTGSATAVTKGSTLQMQATVLPANAVNKNLTWSVANGTGSATISATGLLTPGTAGTVTVKATAVDGSATVGTAVITVQESVVSAATVTGTTTVGSVLTAARVPTAATVSYQWQRATSATGTFTDIGSATSSTYTLVTDDFNKSIRVKVTGTGSYGGMVTSTPSGLVTAPALGKIVFNKTDDTIAMASGNTGVDGGNNTYVLTLTNGTPKAGDVKAAVTVANLPAGLSYTASGNATDKTIIITVAGTASSAVAADLSNVSITVGTAAVSETNGVEASVAVTTFKVSKYVSPLGKLTFTSTDDTIAMASGNTGIAGSNNTYVLTLTNGTPNAGDVKAAVTVANLPAGLSYTASGNATDKTITITVAGTASSAVAADLSNVSITVGAAAVSETNGVEASVAVNTFKVTKYVAALGKITFTSTDDTIAMASGNTGVDGSNNTYVLTLTNGTPKAGDVKAAVTVANLPAGLSYTASGNATDKTITITVAGTASSAVAADLSNVSITVGAGAVSETNGVEASVAVNTFKVTKYVATLGKITFTSTDDTIAMASGNTGVDGGNNTYVLTLTNGTPNAGDVKAAVTVANLPAGLSYTASGNATDKTITITVAGTASSAVTADLSNVSITVGAAAVSETNGVEASVAVNTFKVTKYVAALGKITFTSTDDTIAMASGNTGVDGSNNTYVLTLTNGTPNAGDVKAAVTVANLPAGLSYTANGNATDKTITITVAGTASSAVAADLSNVSITVGAAAVSETNGVEASVAVNTFKVTKYVAALGKITFTSTDDTIAMASGNTGVDGGNNTYVLTLTNGTPNAGDVKAAVTVANLPAGLSYTANGNATDKTITITVAGTASSAVTADLSNVSITVGAGAVSETNGVEDSEAVTTFKVTKTP